MNLEKTIRTNHTISAGEICGVPWRQLRKIMLTGKCSKESHVLDRKKDGTRSLEKFMTLLKRAKGFMIRCTFINQSFSVYAIPSSNIITESNHRFWLTKLNYGNFNRCSELKITKFRKRMIIHSWMQNKHFSLLMNRWVDDSSFVHLLSGAGSLGFHNIRWNLIPRITTVWVHVALDVITIWIWLHSYAHLKRNGSL